MFRSGRYAADEEQKIFFRIITPLHEKSGVYQIALLKFLE